MTPAQRKRKCPVCKRMVVVTPSDKFMIHALSHGSETVCAGSGEFSGKHEHLWGDWGFCGWTQVIQVRGCKKCPATQKRKDPALCVNASKKDNREDAMKKLYHFSLGDSTKGPVGFCATIKAESPERAVEILKRVLPDDKKVRPCSDDDRDNDAAEYIEIYFNRAAITAKNIDGIEED